MKKLFIATLVLLINACGSSQHKTHQDMETSKKHQYTNRLINETSPYLLQHAHNPVKWYPWGEDAFEKAKLENKLVLISIGYAACHWCHVMEHESFEDTAVARVMNDNFVCVKVDREERPDVDHTYMDAVQLMTGSGGWPLNCFALPDGRPVFGGTYFRKEQWVSILQQLAEVYKNDKQRVLQSAEELHKGIMKYNLVATNEQAADFSKEILETAVNKWKPRFDKKDGGNTGAPKFPMPNNYLFLLEYFNFSNDLAIKKQVELSLDKMASGGIYDALGGGFARYSTDALWKVPHFEKMLYDNAQLISVYSTAYKLYKKPQYKQVVYESIAFIERELMSENGAFYSSIDADSEGEEGTFYVWSKKEIDSLLGDKSPVFNSFYGITEKGNWEDGKNVIHQHKTISGVSKEFSLSKAKTEKTISDCKNILFKAREQRIRPITDDKVLTSWNALTITALAKAYRTFNDKSFLNTALKAAEYLQKRCVTDDGKVYRMVRDNHSNIPGFLDDYGLLAQAYIDLYQATFEDIWLVRARQITKFTLQHFYNEETGMFYYSALEDGATISNKTEVSDNVIPSSNSVIAKVLYRLGIYFENDKYLKQAESMLNNVVPQLEQHANYYSNWAILLNDIAYQVPEIVFSGKNAHKLRQEFDQQFIYALVAGSESESNLPLLLNRWNENETMIYVCRNRVCKLPVKSVKEAMTQIKD